MTKRVAGVVLVLLCMSVLDAAGQGERVELSLADAIARGSDASHRLGELDAHREASEAAVLVAKAGEGPQVSVQGGYLRTNHVDEFGIAQPGGFQVVYPDVPDNWRSRVDVQWPIYTGGRVDALVAAARAEAEAASGEVRAGRTDLRLEITRAYWQLVTAREAVAVVDGALARVEAHLVDTRARLAAGFAAPDEVATAQAQRSLQQALLIESKNVARVASLALARLTRLPPTDGLVPTESLRASTDVQPDLETLLAEAQASRADLQALETRGAGAAARLRAAEAGEKPVIALIGGVDYNRPNSRYFPREDDWRSSWDAGISVSWQVFDGGRTRAQVAAAAASERAWGERLAEAESLVTLEVRQRLLELESSRARAAAAGDAVASAAEARRVLQDRYAAGVATATDVVDAQVMLLEAELQQTRALAAVRLAQAGLDRAVGR